MDTDGDGSGDACDATPNGDDDEDGVANLVDSCAGGDDAIDTDGDDTSSGSDDGGNGGNTGGDIDADGDGYTLSVGDCDDADDTIHPGAEELDDDVDNDCAGVVDEGFSNTGGEEGGTTGGTGGTSTLSYSVVTSAPAEVLQQMYGANAFCTDIANEAGKKVAMCGCTLMLTDNGGEITCTTLASDADLPANADWRQDPASALVMPCSDLPSSDVGGGDDRGPRDGDRRFGIAPSHADANRRD